ncbi:MAG: hypothetical protein HZA01_12165 [Nitrospinae bacterium]|nr:hypothetical protein [Nitrospinota bacterium]
MEEAKPRRRRKKHRKGSNLGRFKKEFKLLMIITGLCFLAAVILSFVTGQVPSFINSVVEKQVGGAIQREMKNLGGGAGGMPALPPGMDINQLRRRMGR